MPSYKAPVTDTMFLLTDVFGLHRYENLPRFADAQIDVVEAVLSEGGKLAEEVLQPLNLPGDQEGCKRLPDGSVVTPKGFKEAYRSYVEGGWVGIAGSPAYGGQGLPHFLSVALNEYALAANLAFTMYPALTKGLPMRRRSGPPCSTHSTASDRSILRRGSSRGISNSAIHRRR